MAKTTTKKSSRAKAAVRAIRSKGKKPKATRRADRKTPVEARKSVKVRAVGRGPNGAAQAKAVLAPMAPGGVGGNGPVARPPGKFAKNQAGLSSKELRLFREALLAKRRELLGDMTSMEEEALRAGGGSSNLSNLPIHMADMGTDNYEQEFTLNLVQKDRDLLHEIHLALLKIQNGSYGICEATGKPISRARLEAKPWARYSIEYARQLENRLTRG